MAVHQGRFVARRRRAADDLALTIVIPAWNEARRLPALMKSLATHVDPSTTEVLVVDDGSTDQTARIARSFADELPLLRVLPHGDNRGKGAAVRTGVLAARGRLVSFVDADDATDLSALQPMCDAIEGRVGAVFGSRHVEGSVVSGSPPIRGLMGRVFNHVVRLAAGTSISDTQCGAKVFDTSLAAVVFCDATVDGFAFDVEILRRIMDLEIEVVEHPVRWSYVAGTKIELATPLRMLVDIAKLRFSRDFDPQAVRCSYGPELDSVAHAFGGVKPKPGAPCVVVVAADEAAEVRQAIADLGLID